MQDQNSLKQFALHMFEHDSNSGRCIVQIIVLVVQSDQERLPCEVNTALTEPFLDASFLDPSAMNSRRIQCLVDARCDRTIFLHEFGSTHNGT
uniref:AlNc14C4G577 protein n=1 Tax=Albugo laibachii Nc14 TaxID=890382 RepID=F0W0D4_9STRA|nr:AlNc14C4G577 [Albugo laibachii Nc14]|eukprot:CCA14506.1 AlNc14C4G577 [Albugo laibachii Nc14]